MKNTIIAILVAFALNAAAAANPVIMAELQKMEAAATAKDNQLAAMAAELLVKDNQLASANKKIAELIESPDFEQAVKVKFNSFVAETKTKIQSLTDEMIAKLKKGDK